MNQIDLAGRTAVVTGAAVGLGLAIARRLADSGARVALWDRDGEAATAAAAGIPGAEHRAVDVSDADAVDAAAAAAIAAFGHVDILVNNAGIVGPNRPAWDYATDDWKRVLAVDLDGVFFCCRAFAGPMRTRGYGRICNIASVAGKEGNINAIAYSAAKAGVIGLTKALGKELADRDIAVTCITPSVARTAIFDRMAPDRQAMLTAKVPRGRVLEPEEVAAMVAWVVSAENTFSTASVFDISGGRATY